MRRSYFCKPRPEEFVPPSIEDFKAYQKYMEGLGMGHKTILTHETYIERFEKEHNQKQESMLEERHVVVNDEEDIRRIEKSDGFVRWIY